MKNQIELHVANMHCSSCIKKITDALLACHGVKKVDVDLVGATVFVEGGSSEDIIDTLQSIGHEARLVQGRSEKCTLQINELRTDEDMTAIKKILSSIAGVSALQFDKAQQRLQIGGDYIMSSVLVALKKGGYTSTFVDEDESDEQIAAQMEYAIHKSYRRSALAAVMGVVLICMELLATRWSVLPDIVTGSNGHVGVSPQLFWGVMLVLTAMTMVYSGRHYFIGAWQQLKHASFNMDSLVALGTGVAWLYSAVVIIGAKHLPSSMLNLYLDTSVLILAFLNFGNGLEAKAKGSTSAAIKSLIGLQPKIAVVVQDGVEVSVIMFVFILGIKFQLMRRWFRVIPV